MYGIGDPDRPPLAPGGGLADAAGALNAAMGSMLALRARQRNGGTGQVVDISQQEAVLSVSMEAGPLLTMEGQGQVRVGRRSMAAHGEFPVQDGMVEIVAFLPTQWDSMAEWLHDELGVEEVMMDEFRGGSASRFLYSDLIEGWVSMCSRYTGQRSSRGATTSGACGSITTAPDLLTDASRRRRRGQTSRTRGELGAVPRRCGSTASPRPSAQCRPSASTPARCCAMPAAATTDRRCANAPSLDYGIVTGFWLGPSGSPRLGDVVSTIWATIVRAGPSHFVWPS
jgi:crotonobetainyl-CoA:carnitine CoA-transferase CaiB-like acyl-CoA transferase